MIPFSLVIATLFGAQAQGEPVAELKDWQQAMRQRVSTDKNLRRLADKYPLVVLHSAKYYPNARGRHARSAFSFNHETSDPEQHGHDVQLAFGRGAPRAFDINMQLGQQNLVATLGKVSFEKDPDPTRIYIDNLDVLTTEILAVEGHVYLERMRDVRGNDFYVVFQVVAVDPDSRYIAFLWRKIPGGKASKKPLFD